MSVVADAVVGGLPYPSSMVSPHGFVLNIGELVAEFGSATVSRGTRYANLGRVSDTDVER